MAYSALRYNQAITGLGCGPGGCKCGGKCGGGTSGLGAQCPPCYMTIGTQCVECPEGSTFPECMDCIEGQLLTGPTPWYERPLAGPIVVGLVSAVALGIAIPVIRKQLGKRGILVE